LISLWHLVIALGILPTLTEKETYRSNFYLKQGQTGQQVQPAIPAKPLTRGTQKMNTPLKAIQIFVTRRESTEGISAE